MATGTRKRGTTGPDEDDNGKGTKTGTGMTATTTTTTTTRTAPPTTAASNCSRCGLRELNDGARGRMGQNSGEGTGTRPARGGGRQRREHSNDDRTTRRQGDEGDNKEAKQRKKAQETLFDVSWAVGKFFFSLFP